MSIIVKLLDFKDTDRSRKDDLGSIRETLAEEGTRLGAGIDTYPAIFNFTTDYYQIKRFGIGFGGAGCFRKFTLVCWERFAGIGYQSSM